MPSHALVSQFGTPIQQDIDRLIDHSQQVLQILEATKADAPSPSPDPFVELFATKLSLSMGDAARLLVSLENLQLIDQETDSADKTFSLVATRLRNDLRQKWKENESDIKQILELLGNNHPAAISQKAQRLSYSREHLLVDVDILTDARPIYTIQGDKILAMVISHSLVLTEHGNDHRNRDSYLAMDTQDIIKLRNACNRALLKAKVLKEALSDKPWTTEILRADENA